jgi:hypothetical protein
LDLPFPLNAAALRGFSACPPRSPNLYFLSKLQIIGKIVKSPVSGEAHSTRALHSIFGFRVNFSCKGDDVTFAGKIDAI